jgi:hypothetical protein
MEDNGTYQEYEDAMFGYLNDEGALEDTTIDEDPFAFFDNSLDEIDFSEIEGKSFKKAFSKVNKRIARKGAQKGVIAKAIGFFDAKANGYSGKRESKSNYQWA